MKPMKPMAPMKPMEPMDGGERWWPEELGSPATSGAQDGMRYAVFPDKHRLLIERDGAVSTYDSGDHRIGGVSQSGRSGDPVFTGQDGAVDLGSLKKLG
ncbi:hypothetical protein Q8W71_17240 [Methylobacterium sp. NEAU 140]|uniref:hypothetical protein n=1 Tax=Methylobacterium sp. NEAU 140 TaxID=3064945 RepID=UPI002733CFF1|nr:hypothetical protein [Methylobacterium sp. NEAU 140]MDP4024374.1 hypothetical protein [Methylobacterium sp. NEAU 140]